MRGTTKINNYSSLHYINNNFTNFNKVTTQVAMQRQVINLEDNPLSATIGMKMMNVISRSTQYNVNIKSGIASLNVVDGYLAGIKNLMDEVNKIATGAATDTTSKEQRAANAIELNTLLKSIIAAGNAYDGERYIFGGQQTTKPPFTIVNGRYVNYTGDDKSVDVVVDNGVTMASNVTGSAAYGTMTTVINSRDMNPGVCLATDHATKLSDLNGGSGVPAGKIKISYSSYPEGLEVDLSGCDTLEDVKDRIEEATLAASRALDTATCSWLNGKSLDWHDLQDRYVKVTVNPDGNGLSLQEFDLGEPLPEPTRLEAAKGLTYSGVGGYNAGDHGAADVENPPNSGNYEYVGATTVHDKKDIIYNNYSGYYAPLKVDNFAGNKVADALGIRGTATVYNPDRADKKLDGFLHGTDLNPVVSDRTLLADLDGYNDSTYTITNGGKPGATIVKETTKDAQNVFDNWNLTGLSIGNNTGPDGELYTRAYIPEGESRIVVEIYTVPIDRARPGDLVATGTYQGTAGGGTVVLTEANNSGVGGSVGLNYPAGSKSNAVGLTAEVSENLTGTVHVPAFVEETYPDGTPKDVFNIASGWSIRGLDKPPAAGYDMNHPASTDMSGDIAVNYRYDETSKKLMVELCRPSFDGQPATLIASGELYVGDVGPDGLRNVVSGRVTITGAEGFEGVSGSVYLELPSGTTFPTSPADGSSKANATATTFVTQEDAPAGTIHFGGAATLVEDMDVVSGAMVLTGDTLFKKGQSFDIDVRMANGGILRAGTPLPEDTLFAQGAIVSTDKLLAGTVVAGGQEIASTNGLAAGTTLPRDSYYVSPADGSASFPTSGMGIAVGDSQTYASGHNVRATFATVEDLNRAVEEAGVYVTSRVTADGKGIEFISTLAGAWLTVSEDTDCYEQMGDKNQQISALNLSGLVKGVNADNYGNAYVEVAYYPPDPDHPENKVILTSSKGELVEIDPGYYVRVYSDPDEMKKPYADRDNSIMTAEGFVPAGEWNPDWDPEQPYDPATNAPFVSKSADQVLGAMKNLVLEERNNSGVSGTVDLDYYGGREQAQWDTRTNENGKSETFMNYNFWANDHISVVPGGLRNEGSLHVTMQEVDMLNVIPGQTCDYSGTFHGVIEKDANGMVTVTMYKDSSHTVPVAKSLPMSEADLEASGGKVEFYEVDRYGKLPTDPTKRVSAGGMTIVDADPSTPGFQTGLLTNQKDNFDVTLGAARNNGQERADNIFTTINDMMDAMNQNDVESIHQLLGNIKADIDRILVAVDDAGSRNRRLKNLSERHADDVVKFTDSLTSRVGMDSQALAKYVLEYQAATNAYQAAMQVSSKLMQMSLLQYI